MTLLTRCVASAVAVCLAGSAAWGHTFPPVRTVVVQVERCELAVMVGYRAASGGGTDTILSHVASHPKSQQLDTMRSLMTARAMSPLMISVDGKPLAPTTVRAKIGADPGGSRPMVVVLVTYAIPKAGRLTVTSKDPRTTRISWTDRHSGRVDLEQAPGQGRWFTGVASFLLSLSGPTGDSACAISRSSD